MLGGPPVSLGLVIVIDSVVAVAVAVRAQGRSVTVTNLRFGRKCGIQGLLSLAA